MNVYYVGNRYDGCYYVRCYLPLLHNGWDGDKTSMRQPRKESQQSAQAALAADIVVFQRPDDEARVQVIPLLQQAGKKVVFDNDDTYLPDSGVPTTMTWRQGEAKLKELNANLYQAMRQADLVTTTTEFLADEYRVVNPNVVVLPNMIDPDDWPTPKRNRSPKVRVGLVGSVTANDDYKHIQPLIQRLSEREDVQLVVFGLPAQSLDIARDVYKPEIDFWMSKDIEWQPFVPQADYADTLNGLKLDIMLIPRHDSYFNRCKSNIKFLEASMLEIPVIAQGFSDGKSPYQKPEDAEHMFIATTAHEWDVHTDALIADKALRRSVGKKAKMYVLAHYNIHHRAYLWADAYRTIL